MDTPKAPSNQDKKTFQDKINQLNEEPPPEPDVSLPKIRNKVLGFILPLLGVATLAFGLGWYFFQGNQAEPEGQFMGTEIPPEEVYGNCHKFLQHLDAGKFDNDTSRIDKSYQLPKEANERNQELDSLITHYRTVIDSLKYHGDNSSEVATQNLYQELYFKVDSLCQEQ